MHTDTRTSQEQGAPARNGQEQQNGRDGGDQGAEKSQEHGRSLAEWVSLAISAAIVLGIAGLLTYFQLAGSDLPVMIEVQPQMDQIYQGPDAYYVPIEIKNTGDHTGEDVRVKVSLRDARGQAVETSEISVQFLAGGATSKAVVAFSLDPRQEGHSVTTDAISYLEP